MANAITAPATRPDPDQHAAMGRVCPRPNQPQFDRRQLRHEPAEEGFFERLCISTRPGPSARRRVRPKDRRLPAAGLPQRKRKIGIERDDVTHVDGVPLPAGTFLDGAVGAMRPCRVQKRRRIRPGPPEARPSSRRSSRRFARHVGAALSRSSCPRSPARGSPGSDAASVISPPLAGRCMFEKTSPATIRLRPPNSRPPLWSPSTPSLC